MRPPRETLMSRIGEVRRVSDDYLIAEGVLSVHRAAPEQAAVDLGLLDREREGWRRRQATAELMGGFLLARAAGLSWAEVIRIARLAAAEVRLVELSRGRR